MARLAAVLLALSMIAAVGVQARAQDKTAVQANSQLKDYGEYLSSRCTICHRADGKDSGEIPPIVGIGWDEESFLLVMESFRNGDRTHDAMVAVAKALSVQELKALAIYFVSLEPPEEPAAAAPAAAPAAAAPK